MPDTGARGLLGLSRIAALCREALQLWRQEVCWANHRLIIVSPASTAAHSQHFTDLWGREGEEGRVREQKQSVKRTMAPFTLPLENTPFPLPSKKFSFRKLLRVFVTTQTVYNV